MEGDVAWAVQVSDLHISAYYPDRAADLARLLGPALRVIRPHLLLVTGDITDAKNRRKTTSRQDEDECITYKKTLDAIVGRGGIDKSRIFDIRALEAIMIHMEFPIEETNWASFQLTVLPHSLTD